MRRLCPYWSQAEGVQTQMHREKTDRREVDVKRDRDGNDLSACQGVPVATRSWERQGPRQSTALQSAAQLSDIDPAFLASGRRGLRFCCYTG